MELTFQFINVYITKYETGGCYWPIAHHAIIFSLLLMQTIVLGVFGIKKAPIASSFTIPLIVCTILFHLYCSQRFLPSFETTAAQVLAEIDIKLNKPKIRLISIFIIYVPQVVMEMDRQDEQSGKLEEIHRRLPSAYCQFKSTRLTDSSTTAHIDSVESGRNIEEINDRLRSTYCSFKSSSFESPVHGNLDQFENGDGHRHHDSSKLGNKELTIFIPLIFTCGLCC